MLLPVCEVGLRCAVALGHVHRMHRTSRVSWSQKCEETGLKVTSSCFFPSVAGSSFQASQVRVVVPVVTSTRCSDDTQPAVSEVKNNREKLVLGQRPWVQRNISDCARTSSPLHIVTPSYSFISMCSDAVCITLRSCQMCFGFAS